MVESNSIGDIPTIQPLYTSPPTPKDSRALTSESEALMKALREKEEAKNTHPYIFAWVFVGVGVLWIIGAYVLLWRTGSVDDEFHLSNTVIVAVLGTGTINVLGPAYMVSKYLFGNGT